MVTNRLVKAGRAAGATKRWRSGEAMLLLMVLESMLAPAGGDWRGGGREGGRWSSGAAVQKVVESCFADSTRLAPGPTPNAIAATDSDPDSSSLQGWRRCAESLAHNRPKKVPVGAA